MPLKNINHARSIAFIIRVGVILVLLLFSISQNTFSQDHNSTSLNAASTISLTLTEAIDLAIRANRNLLQSGYGLQNQQLSLESTLSEFDLRIRPYSRAGVADGEGIVGGGVGFDKKFSSGIRASLSPGIEWANDEYTSTTGVSLGIPLLKGFGQEVTLDSVYGSQFSLRTAERTTYMSRVNVALDTVLAAYDINKQTELVKLFTFQRDQLEGHATTARIKERAGLATPIDIYRAEIRQKDAENSLTTARESLANAKDRLKLILSLSMEEDIHVATPMVFEPVDITLDDAIRLALEHRIEIDQRKDDIAETHRNVDIAKHNLLPRLDLVVDYTRFGFSDEFRDKVWLPGEDRWAFYLSSDTDWVRKREKIAYSQSLLRVKIAQLNLTQQQDEIKREVRRQLQALGKDLERIQIRREQLRQAEEKLALAKIKFHYRMADNFDVIATDTDRQRARVDLLSTEIDYIVGTYRLRSVLGTLIEKKTG